LLRDEVKLTVLKMLPDTKYDSLFDSAWEVGKDPIVSQVLEVFPVTEVIVT